MGKVGEQGRYYCGLSGSRCGEEYVLRSGRQVQLADFAPALADVLRRRASLLGKRG